MARIKCIALKSGQTRTDSGKIKWYDAGDTDFFTKVPTNFAPMSSLNAKDIDFNVITEAVLMEDIVPLEPMIDYYKERTGEDLTGEDRKSIVEKIMHDRISPSMPIGMSSAPIPTAMEYKNKKTKKFHESGIAVEFSSKDKPALPQDNALDELLSGD